MLTYLSIRNYKSLHDVTIRPPRFFAVVGANAAGKTNFADVVEFLSSVATSGLASALSEKGGYENICFRRQRRSKGAIRIACRFGPVTVFGSSLELQLDFTFRAAREAIRSGYQVEREEIRVGAQADERHDTVLRIERTRDRVVWSAPKRPDALGMVYEDAFLRQLFDPDKLHLREEELLIWSLLRSLPPFAQLLDQLANCRVFQIMPSRARRPGATSGNQEMGKYGENLPAALEWLQRERPKASRELLEYLKIAVPTVTKVETDYVETRELGLFLREAGMRRRMFSSELSDGTLRTLAMFLPLVDPRYPVVVIEEPENSVHPWVVRQFVEACRKRSSEKQIILTTHSPVLVSKLETDELYVAERVKGETRLFAAREANVELDEVVRRGIQDLGSYWDSGAMSAVPTEPQFEFMAEE